MLTNHTLLLVKWFLCQVHSNLLAALEKRKTDASQYFTMFELCAHYCCSTQVHRSINSEMDLLKKKFCVTVTRKPSVVSQSHKVFEHYLHFAFTVLKCFSLLFYTQVKIFILVIFRKIITNYIPVTAAQLHQVHLRSKLPFLIITYKFCHKICTT